MISSPTISWRISWDVELAFVDAAYTGDAPAQEAKALGIQLEVVKLPEAKRGFVLLPRRWVVENTQSQDP